MLVWRTCFLSSDYSATRKRHIHSYNTKYINIVIHEDTLIRSKNYYCYLQDTLYAHLPHLRGLEFLWTFFCIPFNQIIACLLFLNTFSCESFACVSEKNQRHHRLRGNSKTGT